MPEAVGEELLGDVVLAVGVLKGQIELVVVLQHVQAVAILLLAGEVATLPIDIHLEILISLHLEKCYHLPPRNVCSHHLDIFGKPLCIGQPFVLGIAVGHKPSHLFCLLSPSLQVFVQLFSPFVNIFFAK